MGLIGAGTGSDYPTALDTQEVQLNVPDPAAQEVDAEWGNDVQDAILAIQGELGATGSQTFMRADGTVAMTAGLDMGTFAITNVGNVDGVDVSAHAADATIHFIEGSIDHGSITGLDGDDHEHYLLIDGTRAMTGALDLGTQGIVNTGAIAGATTGAFSGQITFPSGIIQADGKVGINDNSPDAMLDIHTSAAGVVGEIIQLSAAQTADGFNVKDSAGTVLNTIGPTGNVTIGPVSAHPYRLLVAETGITPEDSNLLVTDAYKGRAIAVQGTTGAYFSGRAVDLDVEFIMGVSAPGGGSVFLGATTNHDVNIRTANTVRLTIDNAGLVGINDSSPTAQFEVESATDVVTMAARADSGQTANIFETQDSDENILTVIDKDGQVGVLTSTPDSTLQVVGDVRLGADTTNYFETLADGEVRLHGTAKVSNHIRVSAPSWKGGVSAPTEAFVGVVPVLSFDAASDDIVHYSIIVPFRIGAGTTMGFEVDWTYTGEQDNGTVCWAVEFISLEAGEAVDGGTTTISKVSAGTHTSGQLVRTSFVSTLTGLAAHDVVGVKLYRDVSADTLAADAELIQTHFHFVVDRLGEAT